MTELRIYPGWNVGVKPTMKFHTDGFQIWLLVKISGKKERLSWTVAEEKTLGGGVD